ncbi:protein timeless-like [Littorina saxatilis]|uniref:Uncharacterized protein n=1 Tax=Littorina saxatilis TaxID=31220 RepID=A0AAN9G028_9CAEN
MEWNIMEPGGSGAGGLGCFVGDIYVPSDDCEEILDEIIDNLSREDPKLRNERRKLSFDSVVQKDLVPLVMCCTDEDILARVVRLLANLTQPLDVFLQQGVPLASQCRREIDTLVHSAKLRCTDLDFFKSLANRMEMALNRSGETVSATDSELLNHALLLLRNLLHTGSDDDTHASEASILLQSMLSSLFLAEMDKLVLRTLNHPQKAEWVVSNVQLLSLVFKDYAGALLEGDCDEDDDRDDCESRSDDDSVSDIFEFIPSQTSKFLSQNFHRQLQIGEAIIELGETAASLAAKQNTADCAFPGEEGGASREGEENNMQTDDDSTDWEQRGEACVSSTKAEPCHGGEENMLALLASDTGKSLQEDSISEHALTTHRATEDKVGRQLAGTSTDSGRPNSSQSDKPGERTPEEREEGVGKEEDNDSGVEEFAAMVWDNVETGGATSSDEEKALSELSAGSCLMDGDIIVAYLRKFATDIVTSGLSNLARCLMKALMTSYDGVLDDSFFMWTVGFFVSFARRARIEFSQYRDVLNLDVFGFLVYQGYRNCEKLAAQIKKQEPCPLVRYRLHLVVCSLNQLFQVILTHTTETGENREYIHTMQKCLAQMGDLQRLFILLIRWQRSPYLDGVYLRDLIHTNHTYLLLLEDWVSRGYLPPRFTMLSHIKQYATVDVMQRYGSMLEQYTQNTESLNVAIMTMMYHIAGDCNRAEVLLQLPILKTFSELWGHVTCHKYGEFSDLIEFILESFMGNAFKDPVQWAQKQMFDTSSCGPEPDSAGNTTENVTEVGGLTEEEQDLVFTWSTDLQGSVSIVDDMVRRLHSRGSTATRLQVMLHLLQNGWLEDKQMEALSEEIKELQQTSSSTSQEDQIDAELSALSQEELIPFLVAKISGKGFQEQLLWLQEQLLEAAYVRLGVRENKYRIHVEEPLARFYALQDKSIPLVTVNEEQEGVVREAYFTALLHALGIFSTDTVPSCVFCRIPQFLSPAELVKKAQQLGDIDPTLMKFNLTEVQDDLHYTEFAPLFKNHNADDSAKDQSMDLRPDQSHQWLNYVACFRQLKGSAQSSQGQA